MSRCQQCDRAFSCGMMESSATVPCWCTQMPLLPARQLGPDSSGSARCYCPDCLRLRIAGSAGSDQPSPPSA